MLAGMFPVAIMTGILAYKVQWKKTYTEQDIIVALEAGDVESFRRMIYSPTLKNKEARERIESFLENLITDLYEELTTAKEKQRTVSDVVLRMDRRKEIIEKIPRLMIIYSMFNQRKDWMEYLRMMWEDVKNRSYFEDFFGNMTEEDWERLRKINQQFQDDLGEYSRQRQQQYELERQRRNHEYNLMRRMYPMSYFNMTL